VNSFLSARNKRFTWGGVLIASFHAAKFLLLLAF